MGAANNSEKPLRSPEARTDFHLGYRRWLDGLRGVAILLVMAFHVFLLRGGFIGVDVFFVLSGFLITTLLMEEWQRSGSINLPLFYFRRALRLLPAFLTLLLICGLSCLWVPNGEERWARGREILVAACYLSDWPSLHGTDMRWLSHTWSLSVEEQFYLLWPILLGSLLRWNQPRRRVLLLVAVGILASAGLRMGLYHWYQDRGADRLTSITRLYMGLDTRADALLVGCALGLLAAWNMLPKSRRFLHLAGGCSLVFLIYLGYIAWYRFPDHTQYYHGLFTAVALMIAVLIARLLAAPVPIVSRILESAPLVGVGRISYGLYLFHMPILHITFLLGFGCWTGLAFFVGATFLAAVLSFYLIERPCLRLKAKMRPRVAVNQPASLRLPQPHRVDSSAQAVA